MPPRGVFLAAACAAVISSGASSAEPPTGKPWLDMDYGPFLTASIEAPYPAGNIAMKGVAIRLARALGGARNEAVVFDTDLLRYSVGWTGGYVDLKGVVFDGEHWAYPKIAGEQVFGTATAPGWAHGGSFADPRPRPYGPLPRAWARWRGMYLHGEQVVLAYTVGDVQVLDAPGLETRGGLAAFTRTLEVGPSAVEMIVEVLCVPGPPPRVTPGGSGVRWSSEPGRAKPLACTSIAVAATGPGARGTDWIATPEGRVRLRFPPSSDLRRLKIFTFCGAAADLAQFDELVKAAEPPLPLERWTHGGPPRWPERLTTRGEIGRGDGPFAVDTLTWPDENPWRSWLRFGAFDFLPGGDRAAVTTWNGDVWVVSGIDERLVHLEWQRIATGLYQPLGLKVVGGDVYVLGRDQITRLIDENGDGETDFYECFNNDHENTEHFHEFALDLQTDAAGDFYYMKAARHASPPLVPQHGTLLRVARDGSRTEIVARGFRAPNGLCITPAGEFFSSDQQGHWIPANRINRLEPGGFYGNVAAYHDGPDPTSYDPPLCWIHPSIDRSPSTLVLVESPAWEPLRGQLLSVSYGTGQVFLVPRDRVGRVEQGGVIKLPFEFDTGVCRARFHPRDGALYLAGLYGWAGNKTRPGGFYRVRATGKPLRLPSEFHVHEDGIELGFTDALDRISAESPGSYSLELWNYRWSANYGSPDLRLDGREGRDALRVRAATLAPGARSVFLEVPGLRPAMQAHLEMRLAASDGTPIRSYLHFTIHALGPPRRAREPRPAANAQDASGPALTEDRGLVLELAARDPQGREVTDARTCRVAALRVPAGSAPSPFIPPGPFRASLEASLRLDLDENVVFELRGSGEASLSIAGGVVLAPRGAAPWAARSAPIRLSQGLHPIRIDFLSPPSGDAWVHLFWSRGGAPLEPVPPAALSHSATHAGLVRGASLRRGRELFASRRCARCHPPEIGLERVLADLRAPAPRLEGLGSRLEPKWLERWLDDPAAMLPSATMPRIGPSGTAARDLATRDLAAFLRSDASQPPRGSGETSPPEVAAEGERLWRTLGCFTCHSLPGDALAPAGAPERRSWNASAGKWKRSALVEYLESPGRRDPSTAMPDFRLAPREAAALAAFLELRSPEPEGPAREAASKSAEGDPPRGRELAASLGCSSCHEIPGVEPRLRAPRLEALGSELDRGCLADRPEPPSRSPDFRFSAGDREALRRLLRGGREWLTQDALPEAAERSIAALRCTACHARDGAADAWSELEPLDGSTAFGDGATDPSEPAGTAPGTIHRTRPSLTWAGEKLRPEWTERLLGGDLPYKPRPHLPSRMPAFPAHARVIAAGLALEHGLEAVTPERGPVDAGLAEIGRALCQPGAFVCVQCHPAPGGRALAGPDTETIALERIAERLAEPFYFRFLENPDAYLPGTFMPRYSDDAGRSVIRGVLEGDAHRQFEALWHYLRSIESTR